MTQLPTVCIIGAGFSGLCAGVKLQKKFGTQLDFTIFDENEEVGGTWLVNTYPGCASDVPTHFYSYSFAPNPNWSSYISPQSEILKYLKDVAYSNNLYKRIKFEHQVLKLVWNNEDQQWSAFVHSKKENKETEFRFDIVMLAIGGLRLPNIPQQFESFKGSKMHSAEWDSTVSLKNKKVGIVGSGASGLQIIPAIVNEVSELVVYQRRPPWVFPKLDFNIPGWMQWIFRVVPGVQMAFRACIFLFFETHFCLYQADSLMNKFGSTLANLYLDWTVGKDQDLKKQLEPNYTFACKRILQSKDYYQTLAMPNVKVKRSSITEVKESSIVTEDGNEEKLDVLILATGFRVQDGCHPMKIFDRNGMDAGESVKKHGPSTYLGICANALPNGFAILGHNANAGYTSAVFSLECQTDWIVQVIAEMVERKCSEFRVKLSAEKEFMDTILKDLKKTVWGAKECNSYYVNDKGIVIALSPYSATTLWKMTRKVDFSKIEFIPKHHEIKNENRKDI